MARPGGTVAPCQCDPRLRLDAALSDPPPPRARDQRGRPRLKGNHKPPLETVLADEKMQWSTLTVEDWYGEGPREVEGHHGHGGLVSRGQTAGAIHPLGLDS